MDLQIDSDKGRAERLLGVNRAKRKFVARDCPGLLASTTDVFERAFPALHRHFDGGGASATVGTRQSEFAFAWRHGSLPVAIATVSPVVAV